MGDKRLKDVLSIEDLKKYGNKICIVSGVSSGKNRWVENVLTKHGNVLLVTSRKAVKDQTLERNFFTEKAEWGAENYKVCTHSSIGKFIKNTTNPNFSLNEMAFDYIVIDEAHALVSDATFSEDTNYLWQFITNVKATVILMTATVNWIKEMIEAEGFEIIDKTNECINLRPKNIEVITHKKALEIISEATYNNKMIYMMPSASEAYKIENDFINLGRNDVVAITSSKEKRECKDKERVEREDFTYETLIKEDKLPDDVNILLTTTKLREGVNIKDENINKCITGCLSSIDIRQFAGRIRKEIETLYIVDDKTQYDNNIDKFELDVSKDLIEKIDELIPQYTRKAFGENEKLYARIEECRKFYRMMEDRFRYIKFNRYNNKFEIYNQRIIGCEKEKQDFKSFKNNTWLYLGNIFGKGINIRLNDGRSYDEGIKDKCKLFLQDYIDKPLYKEDIDMILQELTKIGLRTTKKQVYKSLGSALTILGYKSNWESNKHRGSKIITPIENQGKMDII